MKTVLLIGTLDTKGREIAYLRDRVRGLDATLPGMPRVTLSAHGPGRDHAGDPR